MILFSRLGFYHPHWFISQGFCWLRILQWPINSLTWLWFFYPCRISSTVWADVVAPIVSDWCGPVRSAPLNPSLPIVLFYDHWYASTPYHLCYLLVFETTVVPCRISPDCWLILLAAARGCSIRLIPHSPAADARLGRLRSHQFTINHFRTLLVCLF